jgi:hypothetical protein
MRKGRNGDVEQDIYGYMPERFVMMYYQLVKQGLASIKDSLDGAGDRHGKGGPKSGGHVRSERAVDAKRRVDRVLRQLAREAESGMKADAPRCVSCGKFVQVDWKYCSWCGTSQGASEQTKVIGSLVRYPDGHDPRRLR